VLPPVNLFFLEASRRHDEALLDRIKKADVNRQDVGVIHASNDRKSCGGCQ